MTNETETTTTAPRIYVASLADYNAGVLHGEWIDAAQDAEDIADDIERMLSHSPTGKRDNVPADEYAIHDYEGFGPLRLGEYEDIERVAGIATFIASHPEPGAVLAWIENDDSVIDANNADPDAMGRDFDEVYRGCWPSVADYAADYIDSVGLLAGVDELVARYFDFDAFARDLVMGGDIWTAPASGGDVFIFQSF